MRAVIAIFTVSFAACDTINRQQYRIAGTARDDTVRVKRVLRSVADQTGLADRTSTSRVPDTVVFYNQPEVQNFRVDLGARTVGEDTVVDLTAGIGPKPPEYTQARKLLTPALKQEFGPRLSIAPEGSSPAPIKHQKN